MERILEYMITKEQENQSINFFLKSKGFSSQNLILLKSIPDGVCVNGNPVFMNSVLRENDTLTLHIIENQSSVHIPAVNLPLDIIYEDEDLLVINKPAGMPIHPSQNNYDNSLANALAYYFQEQGIPFVFRCINRLDKDTSGLTVVAKHPVSAGILGTMVASKDSFTREYLAIVKGDLSPETGTINAPIARKGESIIEREINFENGERAITHYRLVQKENGHSLVSLILETGRTHQIRVHMKHIGFPLIGDYLYNPDMALINRQALHAHRLSFTHPITGVPMEFVSPLPEDMQSVLANRM